MCSPYSGKSVDRLHHIRCLPVFLPGFQLLFLFAVSVAAFLFGRLGRMGFPVGIMFEDVGEVLADVPVMDLLVMITGHLRSDLADPVVIAVEETVDMLARQDLPAAGICRDLQMIMADLPAQFTVKRQEISYFPIVTVKGFLFRETVCTGVIALQQRFFQRHKEIQTSGMDLSDMMTVQTMYDLTMGVLAGAVEHRTLLIT